MVSTFKQVIIKKKRFENRLSLSNTERNMYALYGK